MHCIWRSNVSMINLSLLTLIMVFWLEWGQSSTDSTMDCASPVESLNIIWSWVHFEVSVVTSLLFPWAHSYNTNPDTLTSGAITSTNAVIVDSHRSCGLPFSFLRCSHCLPFSSLQVMNFSLELQSAWVSGLISRRNFRTF